MDKKDISSQIQSMQKEIASIKERNKNVEADKAWEVSYARKAIVAILTYFTIVVFFIFAGLPSPFLNAIVPSIAFLLSNMTLPLFKVIWIRYNKK